SEVLGERVSYRRPSQVREGRHEIPAEVAAAKPRDEVGEAGEAEQPRRLEVQVTAPAVLIRKHIPVAGGYRRTGCGHRDDEEGVLLDVSRFAPVKARVREQDLDAAHEEREEGYRREPVRHAHEAGVSPARQECAHRADTNIR